MVAGGAVYGPWPAVATSGTGGAQNVNWIAAPSLVLPAGTYTVVDSDAGTWSRNGQSGGQGFWVQPPGSGDCPAADVPCLGEITGGTFDVTAGTLECGYYQDWNGQLGKGRFQLSPDGLTVTGTYSQVSGSGNWNLWRGTPSAGR